MTVTKRWHIPVGIGLIVVVAIVLLLAEAAWL